MPGASSEQSKSIDYYMCHISYSLTQEKVTDKCLEKCTEVTWRCIFFQTSTYVKVCQNYLQVTLMRPLSKCNKFSKSLYFSLSFHLACKILTTVEGENLLPKKQMSYPQIQVKGNCCCFLLSCILLFVTPCTLAHQAPLSMGFPRQEYWSGLPYPTPGDLHDPGIEPASPALQAYSLSLSHHRSPRWKPQLFSDDISQCDLFLICYRVKYHW